MANQEADTDALLKDLESRSSTGSADQASSDGGGDPEDIEAFLRDLEGDEYEPPEPSPTKTAEKDPLADDFAALEEAPEAPMEKAKPSDEKKKKRKKKPKKEKGEVQVVERGESAGLKWAGRIAKWSLVFVPMLAAWWVLGAYLSQWVSAGWLVLALATVVVVGLPLAIRLAVKRGRYIWWAAAVSALLAVGLIAPLPSTAGKAFAHYGHWPATTLASMAGWDSDHILVRANNSVAGWISQLIHPTQEEESALRLGGTEPLVGGEEPAQKTAPTDGEEADAPEKPAAEESEKPAAESEKPAADESEKPAPDESEKPASDESEKPAADESEKPAAEEPEKPASDESEKPTESPPEDG